ncbi:pseudouridine synthase [Talaromyces proteolyticus]|uniref:tRNA pseudouridine(55) synthase n=1 Tax=Talaromyces proteolyticus TaxID=1131652 RepID=A0AAD4PZP7_9EURO|nr:pseudouridine synthase [Talaromyces proteolyticus]KAH8696201.1 pseudouridine synthase [Talaromyces proteolyticus]
MSFIRRGVTAPRFRTAMSGEKIYEGIFAVHKPQGISSAGVVRDLQAHFSKSNTFRSWIEDEQERRKADQNWRRKRRQRFRPDIKIGHGGTLDPMATGVLIAGVGKGTKQLQSFLGCSKTYETVVLFGAETDTYDRLGKVVRRGEYEHVTRGMVEEALRDKFRGKIMQRPPIFSAKRIEGKRLYEYAREGKEPPVEIKSVPVEVFDLRVLEWYEPGTHEYRWPEEEMVGEERAVAERMLDKEAEIPVASAAEAEVVQAQPAVGKRKAASPVSEKTELDEVSKRVKTDAETTRPEESEISEVKKDTKPAEEAEATKETEPETTSTNKDMPVPGPAAVKITMTVSGGFYVRSLAHDLGKAVGSCGLMSSLIRTRQGDYKLEADQVLAYSELEAGEEVWGPKVRRLLEEWQKKDGTAE